MLFYCVFAEDDGLLVDVADEAAARAAAREEVGEPTLVRAVAVFGCRVHFEDDPDDADGEIVDLIALPHVMDQLAAIEDEADDDDDDDDELDEIACMSEAEDDRGNVLRCELAAAHAGTKHKAGPLEWA